jgi:hypothetical protein
MIISNDQRAIFIEGAFVLGCDNFHEAAGSPHVAASRLPCRSEPEAQDRAEAYGLTPAGTRLARWASLKSEDRRVFNIWALWVAGFYAVVIISLVASIALGSHAPAGRTLTASPMPQRSLPELPARATGSTDK